jgi:hypothetical protein
MKLLSLLGLGALAAAKPTTLTFTDITDGTKCRITKDGDELVSTCNIKFANNTVQDTAEHLEELVDHVDEVEQLISVDVQDLVDGLALEMTARQLADNDIYETFQSMDDELLTAIEDEATARSAADTEFQALLTAESNQRVLRDGELTTLVSDEASARAAQDTLQAEQHSALQEQVTSLIARVSELEEAAGTAAANLQTLDADTEAQISALQEASEAADAQLANSLSNLQLALSNNVTDLESADVAVHDIAAQSLAAAQEILQTADQANEEALAALTATHNEAVTALAEQDEALSAVLTEHMDTYDDHVAIFNTFHTNTVEAQDSLQTQLDSLHSQLDTTAGNLQTADEDIYTHIGEVSSELQAAIDAGADAITILETQVGDLFFNDSDLHAVDQTLFDLIVNVSKMEGPQGIKGDTGAQGVQGDTGEQGVQGDTGTIGLTGDTGAQGQKGEVGPMPPTHTPTQYPTASPTGAPTPIMPDASGCTSWELVAGPSTDLPADGVTSAYDGLWKIAEVDNSGLDDEEVLFIRDYQPVWGYGALHFWKTQGEVYCNTPQQNEWQGPLTGGLSCDGRGVGDHECGYDNGWILIHHGATYGDEHPCQAIGNQVTEGSETGNLVYLYMCTAGN